MKNLRRLYGRTQKGSSNRNVIKITITPQTMSRIRGYVEFGRGKSGSAFIELSTELMLALIGDGSDIEDLAAKLENSVDSKTAFSRNLRILSKYVEA